VSALNLRPSLYTKLLDHFHSSGIELDRLSALWARAVLGLFPSPVRINGRLVLVADGIKAPKRGKKMPAVKLLHQQSESNTKPGSSTRWTQTICALASSERSSYPIFRVRGPAPDRTGSDMTQATISIDPKTIWRRYIFTYEVSRLRPKSPRFST
jgi:hypothetical protein